MPKASDIFRKKIVAAIDAGMKKTELAKKTGLTPTSIARYMQGTIPGLDAAEVIAEALGYQSLADFLFQDSSEEPSDEQLIRSMHRTFEILEKRAFSKRRKPSK